MKMTSKFTGFILGAVTAIAASACGNVQQNNGQETDAALDQAPAVAPAFDNQQVASAYSQYIQLKDALVASEESGASAAASALTESLQSLPEASQAMQLAAAIAEAPDIAAQREQFANLSNEMASLVKNSSVTSGEIYLAFCPMANDNAGAFWLANEQEIRNPYFGEKMIKCGEVKETVH